MEDKISDLYITLDLVDSSEGLALAELAASSVVGCLRLEALPKETEEDIAESARAYSNNQERRRAWYEKVGLKQLAENVPTEGQEELARETQRNGGFVIRLVAQLDVTYEEGIKLTPTTRFYAELDALRKSKPHSD